MFGFGIPELIVLLLLVGVPVLIYVVVRKTRGEHIGIIDERYKGVAGWLLFFCISLTVIGPLITLGSLVGAYSDSSKYFNQFPGLLAITVIDTILSLGVMGLSIYAGIGLWRIRPGAVQMAKRYLLCFLGYHAVTAFLPFMAGLPSAANEAMIAQVAKDTFRGIIYVAIWYSYLNKSLRVRATYEKGTEVGSGLETVDEAGMKE